MFVKQAGLSLQHGGSSEGHAVSNLADNLPWEAPQPLQQAMQASLAQPLQMSPVHPCGSVSEQGLAGELEAATHSRPDLCASCPRPIASCKVVLGMTTPAGTL